MSLNIPIKKITRAIVSLVIILGLSLVVFSATSPITVEAGGRPVRVCVRWITLPWIGSKICVKWVTIYIPILVNQEFPPVGCPQCGVLANPLDQFINPVINPGPGLKIPSFNIGR